MSKTNLLSGAPPPPHFNRLCHWGWGRGIAVIELTVFDARPRTLAYVPKENEEQVWQLIECPLIPYIKTNK